MREREKTYIIHVEMYLGLYSVDGYGILFF